MKLLSTLTITVFLAISPSVAWSSERDPTSQELQQLTQNFQQRLPELQNDRTGTYRDRRTAGHRQQITSFVNAWSKVDPRIAPFLGSWVAIEETISIYPSRTPGSVCIIETFIPDLDSSGVSFSLGQASGGILRTSDRKILLRQGNFLGVTFVLDQKPGLYEYGNSRPLENPETVKYFQKEPQHNQWFKQAGCTAELPKVR